MFVINFALGSDPKAKLIPSPLVRAGQETLGSPARGTTMTVCTLDRTISRAGTTHVTCNLNNAARSLRTRQALDVTLTTTFTPSSGLAMASTKTIRLPRTPAPKAPTRTSTTPSAVTG